MFSVGQKATLYQFLLNCDFCFKCPELLGKLLIQAEESSDGTKFDTQYYIWVIPFLLVQCSFFMIPHFIWKMAERGLVKEFETTEANSSTIASGRKHKLLSLYLILI